MEPENFDSHTGKGVSGRVDGKQVLLGNAKLLEEFEVEVAPLEDEAKRLRTKAEPPCLSPWTARPPAW